MSEENFYGKGKILNPYLNQYEFTEGDRTKIGYQGLLLIDGRIIIYFDNELFIIGAEVYFSFHRLKTSNAGMIIASGLNTTPPLIGIVYNTFEDLESVICDINLGSTGTTSHKSGHIIDPPTDKKLQIIERNNRKYKRVEIAHGMGNKSIVLMPHFTPLSNNVIWDQQDVWYEEGETHPSGAIFAKNINTEDPHNDHCH